MEVGDCFRRGHGSHLQIVISKQLDVLVTASCTTLRNNRRDDRSCILRIDDHPFIKHDSFIAYEYARCVSNKELDEQLAAGAIIIESVPASPELISRILEGASKSERIKIGVFDTLQSHGDIP